MSRLPGVTTSLRAALGDAPGQPRRSMAGAAGCIALDRLVDGTSLAGGPAQLAGRSVVIAVRDQFAAALALIELDGVARRLVLCTPDVSRDHRALLAAAARIAAIVCDDLRTNDGIEAPVRVASLGDVVPADAVAAAAYATEWVL